MKRSKSFSLALAALFIFSGLTAQKSKFKFGDISPADFAPKVYSIDSSASAVYLYDVGSSDYGSNGHGGFSVNYHRHARIRLVNKNGFDLATVEISLFKDGIYEDKIEDFQASTYNIEGDKIVATKVDKKTLFKDKQGDYIVNKFTFPNIQEGSIIEYDYTVSSPSYRYIEPWYFQGDYPRLWTEYSVQIPAFYDFITLKQGYVPFVIDSAAISADNFNILDVGSSADDRSETYSFRSNILYHKWAAKDVPVIKQEEYTTTLKNHISKIEFQISNIRYPDQAPRPQMPNWFEAATDLMKNEYFGLPLTQPNNFLDDDIKRATAGAKTDEEKAKAIYEFVRSTYTCTDDYERYLSQSLKKTMQARKGNVVDINILLGAMLQNVGFEVHPVMLSTRSRGKVFDEYPIMSKFNYVVMQAKKDNLDYLLDAADASLGFNELAEDCYNGSARVIAPDLPGIIFLSPDSLKESTTTTVFMINEGDSLSAAYASNLGKFESQDIRSKVKKSGQEDIFKEVKKSFPYEVSLSNTDLVSIDKPGENVQVKYDFKFPLNGDDDILYLSPMFGDVYKENPFKAAERMYPVEMPYCLNETYILNMEVPKGYSIEELPKSARVMLNGEEGMFEYIIGLSGDHIQLRCRTLINKATFEPGDYQTLRDFFGFIVKKEAEQIVLKKQ